MMMSIEMNDNTPFGMTNEEFKTLIDKYIERGRFAKTQMIST